ncbi:unnamed protein product [Arctogadus glacialis]
MQTSSQPSGRLRDGPPTSRGRCGPPHPDTTPNHPEDPSGTSLEPRRPPAPRGGKPSPLTQHLPLSQGVRAGCLALSVWKGPAPRTAPATPGVGDEGLLAAGSWL